MHTANQPIRWGVLGYARIAREQVIPAIGRSSRAQFQALASRQADKLADARSRFGVKATYDRYEALLADPQVDAVYIPLPNSLHCQWVVRAAELGKHILCEKPLALNVEEARRMIAAAKAHGVQLMEAFMYRYTERMRLVRELLQTTALGDLRFINSSFRYFLTNPASIKLRPELGGGALYDVGCYPLNFTGMVLDLLGQGPGTSRPESLSVQCFHSQGIDVMTSALLKYPNGVIATLHCGFNAHRRIHSEIIGTKGVLEVPDTFLDEPGVLTLTTAEGRKEIPVPQSDRYRAEIDDFSEALQRHHAPALGLAESERNMDLLTRLLSAAAAQA